MSNVLVHRPQGGDSLQVDSGGKITAGGSQAAAIADATESTGVANNADVATLVTLKTEHDAVVGKLNGVLAALRGVGIIGSS